MAVVWAGAWVGREARSQPAASFDDTADKGGRSARGAAPPAWVPLATSVAGPRPPARQASARGFLPAAPARGWPGLWPPECQAASFHCFSGSWQHRSASARERLPQRQRRASYQPGAKAPGFRTPKPQRAESPVHGGIRVRDGQAQQCQGNVCQGNYFKSCFPHSSDVYSPDNRLPDGAAAPPYHNPQLKRMEDGWTPQTDHHGLHGLHR